MPNEGLPRSSFEVLYLELEKPVFNIVYRWVWNFDEARDLTQEAFMRLWRAKARVRPETVRPFLFQSAINLARNRVRMHSLRRLFALQAPPEEADWQGRAEESVADRQRRMQVRTAVEALPEKLKAVVMLYEFSGLSTQQIAQTLGIPQGTVGSRRHQAMAMLEQALRGLREEAVA